MKNIFTVPYKGKPETFELHSRPLWDWLMSQVKNPLLAPYFEWDAQCLLKFDGTNWVCFYDEPWTARGFAKVQVGEAVNSSSSVYSFKYRLKSPKLILVQKHWRLYCGLTPQSFQLLAHRRDISLWRTSGIYLDGYVMVDSLEAAVSSVLSQL
jgi:hypothetical protein